MKNNNKERINETMRDKELSREEKIEKIREIHQKQIEEYDSEYFWATFRNWAGGAIIIGSSVIPVTHVVKVLGAAAKISPIAARLLPSVTKMLITNLKMNKPIIRQIITNAIKRGTIEGGFSSIMYGIGTNVQEGYDFKKSIENLTNVFIIGTLLGSLLGGFSGIIGTKLPKGSNRIKELVEKIAEHIDGKKLWKYYVPRGQKLIGDMLKEARIQGLNYYNKYLKNKILKNANGNDIKFYRTGGEEFISKSTDNIYLLQKLKKHIKNGKIYNVGNYKERTDNIEGFEYIYYPVQWRNEKFLMEHQIAKTKSPNELKYYFSKKAEKSPDGRYLLLNQIPPMQGNNNIPYSSKTNNPHMANNTKTLLRQALVLLTLISINKRNGELKGIKSEPIDYNQKYEFIPEDYYNYDSTSYGQIQPIQNTYPPVPNEKIDTTNSAKTKAELIKTLIILIGEVIKRRNKEKVYHQNYEVIPPEDYEYNTNSNDENTQPINGTSQTQNGNSQPQNGHWVTINGNHVFIEDK